MIASPSASASAEIMATPVAEPAPTSEAVVEPTATQESSDEESEPDDESSNLMQPQAVTPSGTMMSCAPNHRHIAPNSTIAVHCTLVFENPAHDSFMIARPYVGPAYDAQITTYSSQGQYYGVLPFDPHAHVVHMPRGGETSFELTIEIRAGAETPALNSVFSACLTDSHNRCVPGSIGEVYIELTGAPPAISLEEGTHYSVDCGSAVPGAVPIGASSAANCTVSALDGLGDDTLQIDGINWTLNDTAGWDISIADHNLAGAEGAIQPDTRPIIGIGKSHGFDVSFTPTACSAEPTSPEVSISVQVSLVGNASESSTSGPQTISASFAQESASSATVIGSPSAVTVPYSLDSAQTENTSLTIRYTVSGCDSWEGYAQMSPFSIDGDSQPGEVPILQSASHGTTSVSGDGETSITNQPISTIGESPTQLISGTGPGQEVVVDHAIDLTYEIPANTPAGTYQSTITVTTTSDAP